MPVTIPLSGTYLDQGPLEDFLVDLFGWGKVEVLVCNLASKGV
jgi:hypothetical protein